MQTNRVQLPNEANTPVELLKLSLISSYDEIAPCALTHITSAAESLWYLSGLDRLWYPMAKLVHQDSKSLDIVEL